MKIKNLLLLVALFGMSLNAFAQTYVGFKGGYTNAWEDYGEFTPPEDADISIDGFHAALTIEKNIGKYFSLAVEPGIIKRGAACVPGWQPIFLGDTKLHLQYAELPIYAGVKLPLLKQKLHLSLQAGYSASYLYRGVEEVIEFNSEEPPTKTVLVLKDDNRLNRWDHGASIKTGIQYNMGIYQINLSGSYYMGSVNADVWNDSLNRNINYSLGIARKMQAKKKK